MQEQLTLDRPRSTESTENPLLALLRDHRASWGTRWIKGSILAVELVVSDRALRDLAESSDGLIISGNQGYCLLENATVEEIRNSANRLISQGRKMARRGIRMLRRCHQMNTAAQPTE